MKKAPNNFEIYRKAAQNLKLQVKTIEGDGTQRILHISNKKKFLLAKSGLPGFYPSVSRWNAFFSNSKSLSQDVLKKLGYRTIRSISVKISDFHSSKDLLTYIQKRKISFPVLLKPDKGFRGKGIAIADNITQLKNLSLEIYKNKTNFLIQPILDQDEYRILVVNNRVELVHSKSNPKVTGDGKKTLSALLSEIEDSKKDKTFIGWQLARKQLTLSSILAKEDTFAYHLTKKPDTRVYKTKLIPKTTKEWALTLAKNINSPVVGIDIFASGSIEETNTFTVIELNSSPGVDYLITYCKDYETPFKIYERVLKNYFKN